MYWLQNFSWFLFAGLTAAQEIEASGLGIPPQVIYRGADISSLAKQESWGKKYFGFLQRAPKPLEVVLKEAGFNTIRLRLLVNPAFDNGLRETLRMAKRVKAAGMKLHLCLHLSDEFADPMTQTIPKAWQSNSIEEVAAHLTRYTKSIGDAFAEFGAAPDFVALGNEIRAGLLWPYGRYPNHQGMSRLLKAGVNGIRASKSSRTKIVIHTDSQGRWDWVSEFFDKVLAYPNLPDHLHHRDFDVIGHTFYPYYASWSTVANQADVMRNCRLRYNKEQHIVETSWPVQCHRDMSTWPADQKSIPFSPIGQVEYLHRVAQLPFLAGMVYWEPAWLTFPGEGQRCEDVLLFEPDGRGRLSLQVFGGGRRADMIDYGTQNTTTLLIDQPISKPSDEMVPIDTKTDGAVHEHGAERTPDTA